LKNKNLIDQLKDDKEKTTLEMAKLQEELDKLTKDITTIENKLNVCKNLIEGFSSERTAWENHLKNHEQEKSHVLLKSIC